MGEASGTITPRALAEPLLDAWAGSILGDPTTVSAKVTMDPIASSGTSTQVTVKLLSGETFRGWIEYYDVAMVRLTREGAPNLFIFNHEIMYISEDNGRRSR